MSACLEQHMNALKQQALAHVAQAAQQQPSIDSVMGPLAETVEALHKAAAAPAQATQQQQLEAAKMLQAALKQAGSVFGGLVATLQHEPQQDRTGLFVHRLVQAIHAASVTAGYKLAARTISEFGSLAMLRASRAIGRSGSCHEPGWVQHGEAVHGRVGGTAVQQRASWCVLCVRSIIALALS
jgi:hypothetical protein